MFPRRGAQPQLVIGQAHVGQHRRHRQKGKQGGLLPFRPPGGISEVPSPQEKQHQQNHIHRHGPQRHGPGGQPPEQVQHKDGHGRRVGRPQPPIEPGGQEEQGHGEGPLHHPPHLQRRLHPLSRRQAGEKADAEQKQGKGPQKEDGGVLRPDAPPVRTLLHIRSTPQFFVPLL